jgi:quinol monooxygenase YgiN
MIAVLYQMKLRAGSLDAYQLLWQQMVAFLTAERGAMGSALHHLGDNQIVIYSRWPDRQTYETSWPAEDQVEAMLPTQIAQIALQMRDCIAGEVNVQVMDVLASTL